MDKAFEKTHSKTHLWPMVGPLFALLTLFVVIIRSVPTPAFVLTAAIGGVCASYLWRWKGAAAASVCLVAALVYALAQQPAPLFSWTILLGFSIAATFVVTVLCSEEALQEWDGMARESGQMKATLAHVTSTAQAGQKQFVEESRKLSDEIAVLRKNIADFEQKAAATDKLIKISRQELAVAYAHKERVLQDLAQLRERNAELLSVQEDKAQEGKLEQEKLGKEIVELERKIEEHRSEVHRLQAKVDAAQRGNDEANKKAEELGGQVVALRGFQEESRTLRMSLEKAEHDFRLERTRSQELILRIDDLDKRVAYAAQEAAAREEKLRDYAAVCEKATALEAHCENLSSQVEALTAKVREAEVKVVAECQPVAGDPREVKRLEGCLKQMRQQFDAKSEELNAARRDLFRANEQALALQKDLEEEILSNERDNGEAIRKVLDEAEKEIAALEHDYAQEVSRLNELVDRLMSK